MARLLRNLLLRLNQLEQWVSHPVGDLDDLRGLTQVEEGELLGQVGKVVQLELADLEEELAEAVEGVFLKGSVHGLKRIAWACNCYIAQEFISLRLRKSVFSLQKFYFTKKLSVLSRLF